MSDIKDKLKNKHKVVIDDSDKGFKTTIKPSQREIEEIKKLWEKFHEELLKRVDKKSEE